MGKGIEDFILPAAGIGLGGYGLMSMLPEAGIGATAADAAAMEIVNAGGIPSAAGLAGVDALPAVAGSIESSGMVFNPATGSYLAPEQYGIGGLLGADSSTPMLTGNGDWLSKLGNVGSGFKDSIMNGASNMSATDGMKLGLQGMGLMNNGLSQQQQVAPKQVNSTVNRAPSSPTSPSSFSQASNFSQFNPMGQQQGMTPQEMYLRRLGRV